MAEVLSFLDTLPSSNPSLHAAFTASLHIIISALHIYRQPRELCLSFNGGKDSTVVLHLLRAALLRYGAPPLGAPAGPGAVYFSGSRGGAAELPEVTSFTAASESRYAFSVETLAGFKEGLGALVARPEGEGRMRCVLMGTRADDPDGKSLIGPLFPHLAGVAARHARVPHPQLELRTGVGVLARRAAALLRAV